MSTGFRDAAPPFRPARLLQDLLHRTAAERPERDAIVAGSGRLTFGELEERSNRLAHRLRADGVVRGDRVLVFADNVAETVIAFWGVLKADAVVSVINPQTKTDKLLYLLADSGAAALVTQGHLARVWQPAAAGARELRSIIAWEDVPAGPAGLPKLTTWDDALASGRGDAPPRRANIDLDLASIIYTSGSTGDAKGVMLSHRNMLTACASILEYLGTTGDDVTLCVLPMAFDYGLYQMIMAVAAGARLVLERSFAYPAEVLRIASTERVTVLPLVPTLVAILADLHNLADYDLSSVRTVTSTAASLSPSRIEWLRRAFPGARVFSMYGLTECKRCTYLPPEDLDRKPGSVGIAIPNTEVWVVDDAGNRLAPGEVGQFVVRGGTVMQGYWRKPEETAKKLRPGPMPGERVLYSGDYCRLDDEGYVYFVGRMDDIIKCRGEKVAPKEVENALQGIPGVREAAVIGVPDDVLGQAVKAFVVPRPGAVLDERTIIRECQARLESFMVPKHVAIVDELPLTATGKISKRGLS